MIQEGVLTYIQLGENLYCISTSAGDQYKFFTPQEFSCHKPFELILTLENGISGIFPLTLVDALGDLICDKLQHHSDLVFYYVSSHNGIGTIEDLIVRYLGNNKRNDVCFLRENCSIDGNSLYYGFLFSDQVPLKLNLESQFYEIKNNL